MSDEFADDVQPDQGQGDASTSDAPYAEYLNRIPEEVRGDVEPVFRDWDANVTKKFQDASQYRQTWEPYEQVGVNRYDPQSVQWALQFKEAAESNPQAIQQWFQAYAQEHGLEAAQQAAAQVAQPDEFAYADPDTQQLLQQQLQTALSPLQQQMEQLNSWREQQEQQAAYQEAQRYVEAQLTELEQKHPAEFNREWVGRLVANHIETNPQQAVQLAWQDFQTLRGQLEKQVFEQKANAPAPAESGGVPDGSAEEIKTMAQAREAVLARLRGGNA